MCFLACVRTTVCFCMACVLFGCVSFQSHQTPSVKLDASASSQASIFIDVKYHTQSYIEAAPSDNAFAAQAFRTLLSEVLRESSAFKSYTFNETRGTNADYRAQIVLNQKEEGSIVSAVICGATLTVIPGTFNMVFDLNVTVKDKNDVIIKNYRYADSVRTWMQILLLPFSFFKSPGKETEALQKNMIRAWIRDASTDGIFKSK